MHLQFRHLGTILVLAVSLSRALHAQADEDKTPLGMRMSAMNGALKLITAQVTDSTLNASTLEQVAIFQSNATEAMTFRPEKTGEMPEAEQERFLQEFRAGISSLLVTVDSLKAAVQSGRNSDAERIVEVMKQQQREKHGVFRIRKPPAPLRR